MQLHTTMYIQNRRDSSKIKDCSPLQYLYNLIVKCHAIAYFAYTHRYSAFKLKPKKFTQIMIKGAYNKRENKYRFKKINKNTKTESVVFWDEQMASLLVKQKFPETSNYYFEVYPYKLYPLRTFLWSFPLFRISKNKKNIDPKHIKKENKIGGFASAIIIATISGIIVLIVWSLWGNQIIDFLKKFLLK